MDKKMIAAVNKVMAVAAEKGCIELRPGVHLVTASDMVEDQKTWPETDEAKNLDFSKAPFWVTTDSGDGPFPVDGPDDLEDLLGEDELIQLAERIQSTLVDELSSDVGCYR